VAGWCCEAVSQWDISSRQERNQFGKDIDFWVSFKFFLVSSLSVFLVGLKLNNSITVGKEAAMLTLQ